jgi:hypothetical protein
MSSSPRHSVEVGFRPQRLCSRRQSLLYSFSKRLGGPQRRPGSFEEVKNLLSLPGIEPRLVARPARILVTILTSLSRADARNISN